MTASTNKWKAAWRAVNTRQAVAYVTINIIDGPSFYFATRSGVNGGVFYDGVISGECSVTHRTEFMASDIQLAGMSFNIHNQALSSAGGKTFSWLLSQYEFIGASVVLQICTEDINLIDDGLIRFYGVIQTIDIGVNEVSIKCLQRRDWNKSATPKFVNRAEHPYALEETVGSPIPIVFGDLRGPKLRNPHISPYDNIYKVKEMISGGKNASQCVVIDAGGNKDNQGKAVVIASSSPIKLLGRNNVNGAGASSFIKTRDDKLHAINSQNSEVFNSDSTGAGFYIVPNSTIAFAPIYPTSITAPPYYDIGLPFNPEALIDVWNDVSVATFNTYTMSYRIWPSCQGRVITHYSSNEEYGDLKWIQFSIIYKSSVELEHFRIEIFRSGTATNANDYATNNFEATLPSTNGAWSVYQTPMFHAWEHGMPTNGWAFGGEGVQVSIGFPSAIGANSPWVELVGNGDPRGYAEVMSCGFTVAYNPKKSLIGTKKIIKTVNSNRREPGQVPLTTYEQTEAIENVTAIESDLYTNAIGVADNVAGDITGTSTAPIEKATDIAWYVLKNIAGDSNITYGDEFGSFTNARLKLVSPITGNPMVYGLSVSEAIDVNKIVSELAEASVSQPILSPFTNSWEWHPWEIAASVTYPVQICKSDLLDIQRGISIMFTPDSNIMSGIRVMYGYNDFTRSFAYEAGANSNSSNSGFEFRNMRDGNLTVLNDSANIIDWVGINSGSHAYKIPAGNYTTDSLLTALHNVFIADLHSVSYGFRIIGGVNDQFTARYKLAGVFSGNYTCLIQPGNYTADGLAFAIESAINTKFPSMHVTVSYDADNRKFKFEYPYSSDGILNQIQFLFLTFSNNSAASAMGFAVENVSSIAGQALYSSYPCMPFRYSIALSEPFDIQWQSGINGLYGTKKSAWEILGFDWSLDSQGRYLDIKRHTGVCFKSNIESLFANSAKSYANKRDVTRAYKTIFNTGTAIEVRDRIAYLMTIPRATITFSSDVLADLRVGDIFEFNEDVNELQECPIVGSEGSWANRRWRVLETTQKFGSSWHTEVVAVDLTT